MDITTNYGFVIGCSSQPQGAILKMRDNRKHTRNHYAKNKKYYLDKNKRKKQEIKDHVNSVKAERGCSDCGVKYPDEPWLFDFDHVRGEKRKCVAQLMTLSLRVVKEEIEKCDVVCLICHRRRTARRAGWGSSPARGTIL